MKKKMIFAGVAMLLTAAAVTGYTTAHRAQASDLFSANVEALTRGEGPINPDCPNGCLIKTGDGCFCFERYPDKTEKKWD